MKDDVYGSITLDQLTRINNHLSNRIATRAMNGYDSINIKVNNDVFDGLTQGQLRRILSRLEKVHGYRVSVRDDEIIIKWYDESEEYWDQ